MLHRLCGPPSIHLSFNLAAGDLYQMEQIRREHPDLVLYNGYDEIFASGLLAGADGGIGSTYNIMGWRYQGIVKALKEGDIHDTTPASISTIVIDSTFLCRVTSRSMAPSPPPIISTCFA